MTWKFTKFGSSFYISHCHKGGLLIRTKKGEYQYLFSDKDRTLWEQDIPGICRGCQKEVPDWLVIQMKLLSGE